MPVKQKNKLLIIIAMKNKYVTFYSILLSTPKSYLR